MTEFALPGGAVLGLMPEAGIRRLLPNLPDPALARGVPRAEAYLMVASPSAYLARAVAAGATELAPVLPHDWGDDAGYCLDPDGDVLAFAARHEVERFTAALDAVVGDRVCGGPPPRPRRRRTAGGARGGRAGRVTSARCGAWPSGSRRPRRHPPTYSSIYF